MLSTSTEALSDLRQGACRLLTAGPNQLPELRICLQNDGFPILFGNSHEYGSRLPMLGDDDPVFLGLRDKLTCPFLKIVNCSAFHRISSGSRTHWHRVTALKSCQFGSILTSDPSRAYNQARIRPRPAITHPVHPKWIGPLYQQHDRAEDDRQSSRTSHDGPCAVEPGREIEEPEIPCRDREGNDTHCNQHE